MAKKASHIFRKEALKRLSSPERLDTRMEVVGRRAWLPLLAAGVSIAMFLVWSIYGLIPFKAVGRGVLIHPNKTLSVGASSEGVISLVEVKEGQQVTPGQVLARVELPHVELELEQARARLGRLVADHEAQDLLAKARLELERQASDQRRGALEAKIEQDQAYQKRIQALSLRNLERQRSALSRRLKVSTELTTALKQHYLGLERVSENVLQEDIVEAREAWAKSFAETSALEVELEATLEREAELVRSHRALTEETRTLQEELAELTLALRRQEQEEQARVTLNRVAREEVQALIAGLELKLERESKIVVRQAGRVLELKVAAGHVVKLGEVVALLEVSEAGQEISCLTFVPSRSGKRMFPGMEVLVAPDTVERERFGGIVGEVTHVTRYPLTTEAAARWLGSTELAEELLEGRTAILVTVRLSRDPEGAGGFRWSSSKGPPHGVSSWTTCDTEIVLERRAPITLALPFLKSLVN